ncbi:hypothetical protein BDV93DRAFT_510755 [Ceratobasidium sp. AG-I]|nr:hypothetical protein BDV93DRAFT_510755 [Ceratobasidium sp. AG-I]
MACFVRQGLVMVKKVPFAHKSNTSGNKRVLRLSAHVDVCHVNLQPQTSHSCSHHIPSSPSLFIATSGTIAGCIVDSNPDKGPRTPSMKKCAHACTWSMNNSNCLSRLDLGRTRTIWLVTAATERYTWTLACVHRLCTHDGNETQQTKVTGILEQARVWRSTKRPFGIDGSGGGG